MKNPYDVLGVSPAASQAEIQSAYRKLAKKLHPDLNPGDKTAEDKFKDVSAAYDLLGDEDKRRKFDAGDIDAAGAERPRQHFYRDYAGADTGHVYNDPSGFADFMETDDIIADLLRRSQQAHANRRGQDMRYRLAISLAESIAGASKRITLPDGGTLDVKIPAGMVSGQTLRLKGKGAPGGRGGKGGAGDALIEIEVLPDPRFAQDGDDLTLELPVSLNEAVLGGRVRVPTPVGAVTMTVPKGSNSGTTLRLKGKGAPRRNGGFGDQFVRLKVVLPSPPDPELEAFVSTWEKGKAFNPRKDG